jgi:hypothetical protein
VADQSLKPQQPMMMSGKKASSDTSRRFTTASQTITKQSTRLRKRQGELSAFRTLDDFGGQDT